MYLNPKLLILPGILAASMSQAVVFSNVTISANANGIFLPAVYEVYGNTIAFGLPGGTAVFGPKTLTLNYTVDASAGNYLHSLILNPGGVVAGQGSLTLNANHENGSVSETATFFQSAWFDTLGDTTYVFNNQMNTWDVTTTLDLVPVASSLWYKATYCEQPVPAVPEPMTMGALAAGLGGLLLRRRKKNAV